MLFKHIGAQAVHLKRFDIIEMCIKVHASHRDVFAILIQMRDDGFLTHDPIILSGDFSFHGFSLVEPDV